MSNRELINRYQPSNINTHSSSTILDTNNVARAQQPASRSSSRYQVAGPNLFANLLLNREEVYSDGLPASLDTKPVSRDLCDGKRYHSISPLQSLEPETKSYIPAEDWDVELLLEELLSMAPMTRIGTKRCRSPKQAAVNQESSSSKAKKPATSTTPKTNDAKRRKTEASSSCKHNPQKQLLGGNSHEARVKVETPDVKDIIEISDDEEDGKTQSRPSRSEQPPRIEGDHAQELQRLRQELAASKQELVSAKAVAEAAKTVAETAKAETEATRTMLRTKDEEIRVLKNGNDEHATSLGSTKLTLEALRANLRVVTRERDKLQVHAEEHRSTASDHILVVAELKDAQSKLQALQAKCRLSQQKEEPAETVHTLTQDLFNNTQPSDNSQPTPAFSFSPLSQYPNKHTTPPTTPTFATLLNHRATPSASPFRSSASLDEQKNEGIRRTYVKIKMKYDNLHSVLISLANCTQGMDLSSFGEFGRIIRQVRVALEEDRLDR